jgi:rod shape-determining protein MreC
MNNKLIFTIILSIIALLLFQKEERFQESFSKLTLPIKEAYLNFTNQTTEKFEKHTSQAKRISELKKENILLRKYLYQQKMTINQLQQYSHSRFKKYESDENVLQVQTISYKKMNDFSSIYLSNHEKLKNDKIYGLIQKNVAAGIAIKNDNLLEGILLSNEKCKFSTFIGEKRMPGIAKGIDEKTMEINFIPKWSKIAIGDKVVTSGLDNIFLANIPVGIVKKILTRSTYKTAIIETYANVLHPEYFYLVKKVPIQLYDINKTKKLLENNQTKPAKKKQPKH